MRVILRYASYSEYLFVADVFRDVLLQRLEGHAVQQHQTQRPLHVGRQLLLLALAHQRLEKMEGEGESGIERGGGGRVE